MKWFTVQFLLLLFMLAFFAMGYATGKTRESSKSALIKASRDDWRKMTFDAIAQAKECQEIGREHARIYDKLMQDKNELQALVERSIKQTETCMNTWGPK